MATVTGPERWSLIRAFLAGAVVGAMLGALWSWIDYGALDIGYMSNHVLGGTLILGVLFCLVAAFVNWRRRNPL